MTSASLSLAVAVLLLGAVLLQAEPVTLCSNAGDPLALVTAADAGESVRGDAQALADMLARMTGRPFALVTGDGRQGIAVGLASDFPALGLEESFTIRDLADREHFLLRTHPKGLLVVGATETAVSAAVWDFLYRLGYRQFFPGDVWEVVPRHDALRVDLDVRERPDYVARRIWYGYGLWDYNREAYERWCTRNRAVSGFALSTGHAYGRIIRANAAAFEAHPEFYGLHEGERGSSKLCIGNPELRALVARHARSQFEAEPDLDSISVDPSDGGGWCECERCAALGSVSDRAVTLANTVARALARTYSTKYVGMYAYNQHSPPPSVAVHPHVVISIATGFIRGGYTVDELFTSWGEKGNPLGVREYFSVFAWDRDLPGRARGGNLTYLKETIPRFHDCGARFYSAESGDNWGANGLGYYVAARLLWDVDEADDVQALVDDFLAKAFGEASQPMRQFYALLDGGNRHPVCEDLVGRMYRCLYEAKQRSTDEAVRARLDQLVLYTRYVELYRAYEQASGTDRQQAFEALIRHAYRTRQTMMVHVRALYRDLVRRDKAVTIPAEALWNVPEADNPWKASANVSESEIRGLLASGLDSNQTVSFSPVRFSDDLRPASLSRGARVEAVPEDLDVRIRGVNHVYLWVDDAPAELRLRVTGGLIAHYRDRGPVELDLTPREQEFGEPVSHAEVPPDGVEREVVLRTTYEGLHVLRVSDGRDMTRLRWSAELPMAVPSSLEERFAWQGRADWAFYVPAGTRVLGAFVEGSADILDGEGNLVRQVETHPGDYVAIEVPAGQDGRVWTLRNASGRIALLTVPPYLAPSAGVLLLPRDALDRRTR